MINQRIEKTLAEKYGIGSDKYSNKVRMIISNLKVSESLVVIVNIEI